MVTHPAGNAGDKRPGFSPWVGKIPWRRKLQPTPVFLLGKLQRETYRDTECTRTHTRFKAKRFKGTNKTPKGTSLYLRPISSWMHFKQTCILDTAVLPTISVGQGLRTWFQHNPVVAVHLILYAHFFTSEIPSQSRTDFYTGPKPNTLLFLSSVQVIALSIVPSEQTAEKHKQTDNLVKTQSALTKLQQGIHILDIYWKKPSWLLSALTILWSPVEPKPRVFLNSKQIYTV